LSNPTTPFSWQMPQSTDLVTDLPADFEVFGQAVATSMADLLGGTSGQILAKNSNTDMDFVWIANDQGDITGVTAGTGISGGGTSGTVTVTNSMATAITTAGDLIKGTGSGTFDRLGIGSAGQILTVTAGAPAWATPAAAPSGPAFSAYRATSNQSFSQATWTKVQLNAEVFDTANAFDSTTNYRFTPATAGYYQFNGSAKINKTGQSVTASSIYKNGINNSKMYEWVNTGTDYTMGGSDLIYLNGTSDYVELYVWDNDPSARNVAAESQGSRFSGVWIRS
jgi:hypothetical protein